MDRLRAIEYFVRVVEAGSFARAAHELDVSPPAVTQQIAALERELGTRLLRRGSRHLGLTPDGEQFLPACASALAELRAAEAQLSVNRTRASGKLVVGVPLVLGAHCVAPFLPEFLARYPDLALDLRIVNRFDDPIAALVDVLLAVGWPQDVDLVAKRIAQTRLVTCASPAYWRQHGRPQDPDELRSHQCLAVRLPGELVVLDLWKYRRGAEQRSVAIAPRIVSDNVFWNFEAAVRGTAVIRCLGISAWPLFEQRLLEPVLEDWEALEAPAVYAMYRRGLRSARVRAFVDFAAEIFARLEAARPGASNAGPAQPPVPAWVRSRWVGPLTRRARMP